MYKEGKRQIMQTQIKGDQSSNINFTQSHLWIRIFPGIKEKIS
jgi:hypothetical protein